MDAGKFDQPVSILTLSRYENGWRWEERKKTWASVEVLPGKNLFSSSGIGAKSIKLILRHQEISLHEAVLWRGNHLFLTAIRDNGRLYLDIDAALVTEVTCTAVRQDSEIGKGNRPEKKEVMRVTFPGVLTEKYAKYEREETHAENDTSYVLVVPKSISLKAGDLVTVQDGPAEGVYNVTICHVLDEFKNEYEITWRGDV